MSHSDAMEAAILNWRTHRFGDNLIATGTAAAEVVDLEQGIPLMAVPAGAGLVINGNLYIVETGQSFSATGTITDLALTSALADSPSDDAVTNVEFQGVCDAAQTVAKLETGTDLTEAAWTVRKPITYGTVSGSGDDAATPSKRANTAAVEFDTFTAGGNLYAFPIWLTLTGTSHYLGYADTVNGVDPSESPIAVSAGGDPSFAIGALEIREA